MDPDVIRLLEFATVKQVLAGQASTPPGRALALALEPMDDLEDVALALAQTDEMVRASREAFRTPLGGVEDVRVAVERAAAGGGPLEGPALWQIVQVCDAAERIGSALRRLKDSFPLLSALGEQMPALPDLRQHIQQTVETSGKLRDNATPRLAELRAQIIKLRRRIEDILDSLIHETTVASRLQYPNPSIHHDRYVLAVNSYHRNSVPGIVHGTSDSGATLYIEPLRTLELGNQLSEAIGLEEEEAWSILWNLTRHVAHERDRILTAQGVLAQADLIAAKARMAGRYRMCLPEVSAGRVLELRAARHPILLALTERTGKDELARTEPNFDAVVPMDVHLGDDFRVLVVTGPNTGGKTVTLKTIGLLCLMARAGMFVPAERAAIPLFDSIYVDIGDEQSLQQSLSTFSSHISRIARILDTASARALVLLDELGSGTDPIEGAALGEAILNELVERGCSAVVTTHLGQLKTFASACPAVENACVEFDTETLRPTYRLSIGMAGHSNALEIAARLGMPRPLLDDARSRLDGASGGAYGQMLDQVRQASLDSEERRRRTQYLESEAEKLRQEYEERLRRIKHEEERTGADIGLKMKSELEALERAASLLHDDVRFSHKALARKVRQIRDGLRHALGRTEEIVEGHAPRRPVQSGDEVYIAKIHKWGQVLRVDEGRDRAMVVVAGRQMDVALEDLTPWGSDRKDE
jgi:DNA mismatch repair protein MutS2